VEVRFWCRLADEKIIRQRSGVTILRRTSTSPCPVSGLAASAEHPGPGGVPFRVKKILDEGTPEKYGITNRSVLAIFRKWSARHTLEAMEPTNTPH
jgi:hypothetical protein